MEHEHLDRPIDDYLKAGVYYAACAMLVVVAVAVAAGLWIFLHPAG